MAKQFVSKYYDVLEKHPKYLHRFFKEDSSLTVVDLAAADQAAKSASSDVNVGYRAEHRLDVGMSWQHDLGSQARDLCVLPN